MLGLSSLFIEVHIRDLVIQPCDMKLMKKTGPGDVRVVGFVVCVFVCSNAGLKPIAAAHPGQCSPFCSGICQMAAVLKNITGEAALSTEVPVVSFCYSKSSVHIQAVLCVWRTKRS